MSDFLHVLGEMIGMVCLFGFFIICGAVLRPYRGSPARTLG